MWNLEIQKQTNKTGSKVRKRFKNIVEKYLGNKKDQTCQDLVNDEIKSDALEVISLTWHIIHSNIGYFIEKLEKVAEEKGERFL